MTALIEQVSRNGLSQDVKIAVASLAVFVITSVSFFITGFLCRHCAHVRGKSKTLSEPSGSPSEERPIVPLYDDVIPQQQTQKLELNVNVAYGRSRC